MYTEFDIYKNFIKIKASVNNRGYRLPKDWIKYYSEKLTENQQQILIRMSKYFSTVWQDINIEKYFECGFELFPKLNYHLFFNKKIMQLYKRKDKLQKNDLMDMKNKLIKSSQYVILYMKDKKYTNLINDYCKLIRFDRHVIIDHYLNDHIDGYFLSWMIAEGYIDIYYNNYDFLIPIIIKNYRTMYNKLNDNKKFIDDLKMKINKK